MTLRLVDVDVDGRRCDVIVADGLIAGVEPAGGVARDGTEVIDGGGGALIPGLWDHHIHLLAAAAAPASVTLDSSDDSQAFANALRRADIDLEPGAWIRVVGYHESIAGDIDRADVDRAVAARPVRVQHRSGARWILNSAACDAVALHQADHPGVERGPDGTPTGRVTGADDWLGLRVPPRRRASGALRRLGETLVAAGVVGVTDTTPDDDTDRWDTIAAAAVDGDLRTRVMVTGGPRLTTVDPSHPLLAGPVKLYLADHSLPDLDTVTGWVRSAHERGRRVAFHSVTRVSLAIALAALDTAGSLAGDRIEHGAVIGPDAFDALARHRLTVVTQPGFVAERGDDYRRDVAPDDVPDLYRCASLLAAGIAVAGSSDAPYSDPDPWRAMAAAVGRHTRSGNVLGPGERVTGRRALGLFLGHPDHPGGPERRVEVGAVADLCLLDGPLADVVSAPSADRVRATIIGGDVVFER